MSKKKNNEEEIVITSNDDLKVNIGSYTLANRKEFKKSRLSEKFKDSALGQDIGVHSKGFTSMAILATIIAIAVIGFMILFWKM